MFEESGQVHNRCVGIILPQFRFCSNAYLTLGKRDRSNFLKYTHTFFHVLYTGGMDFKRAINHSQLQRSICWQNEGQNMFQLFGTFGLMCSINCKIVTFSENQNETKKRKYVHDVFMSKCSRVTVPLFGSVPVFVRVTENV